MNHLTENWQIHNHINLYLPVRIAGEYLNHAAFLEGPSVGEQFAHMNNVRLTGLNCK